MAYIDENLITGETILYRTRLHWIVMAGPVVLSLVLGIPGLLFLFSGVSKMKDQNASPGTLAVVGLTLLTAGIVAFCAGILHRSSTEMAVTNKRVLIKVGLISRNTTEMMLSKIESVIVNQSVTGRIFGYGTIIVRGTGGTPEPFDKIAHPLEFRCNVQQQLDKIQSQASASSAGI